MFACAVTQRLRHGLCLGSVQRCSTLFTRAWISQALRSFSDAPATTKDLNKPIKQWELLVSPYTKVRCHLGCNISIKPLDPHNFPESDRVFITVHVIDANQTLNVNRFHVHYDDQSNELQILADEMDSNVTVELTAPIKCDLHIKTKDKGNVKIQNMESDLCHVLTERGHCVLKSVKGHEVQVQSTGGNVTGLKTLHGNVDIRTSGDSNIDIKKIQGTTMNLSTEHGDLKVKAIYGESTSMSTSSGNIQIGHVHGEALVRSETGNIMIDSSSGALKVFTAAGNIDAYVGQDGSAELHSQQGAVSVRFPSSMKTAVQLCGTSVSISSEIECQETEHTSANGKTTVTARLNGGMYEERWIKATAEKGAVNLRNQSWFETLRLGAQS
ncbi:protein FAM185A isoform X2 [Rhinichthys klamathensis goyatoka]|uniref:protein FAM185A isoform X1 n=1 Tax=Rhinichthys klamathensis goyatoka TaxID=3034132 RepID=UPI0024B4ADF8|nr:protein FAM185A isoform X1 [Rhinichthys klamathensis goyatoka]XP_056107020.1 protein FAM185A isoform X2 [Rhinichthys klamathensis goyatoka]